MKVKILATAVVAGLVLTGCGGGASETTPEDSSAEKRSSSVDLIDGFDSEGHFAFGALHPPSSFDPYSSTGGLDQTFLAPIYDRLVYSDPDGELQPMLAETYEVDEAGALVLGLREGLSFTDGESFDSDAVKTNIERYKEEGSRVSNELSHISGVEVVDEYTIKLETSGGSGAALAALSGRAGMMVSPKAIDEGTVETNPVGVGPYTATAVTPGERVELEATSDYWDPDAQRVATMDLVGMQEGQTRMNALLSGQLDAAQIDAIHRSDVEDGGSDVVQGSTPAVYYIALNTEEPAFSDPQVRQAISMALDREGIAEALFDGACTAGVQPWTESSFAFNDEIGSGLDQIPFDPEAAKELLAQTDFADAAGGFDAAHSNISTSTAVAEVVQSQLAEIGITVNPRGQATGGIVEQFSVSKKMPMAISTYTGSPDPDAFYQRHLSPDGIYNPGAWSGDRVSELAAEGADTVDSADRGVAYQEMAQLLLEDEVGPYIPICASERAIGYDDSVSNLHVFGEYQDLRGVAVSGDE